LACQPLLAVAGSTDTTQTWPIAVPSSAQTALDQTPIVAPKPQQLAQAGPGTMRPGHIPLWPAGLEYTIDASIAWAMGTTGAPQGNGLPGGMDVIARWGFSPSSRLVIGYYDLQEYPAGFDVGTVPVYLQGVATPIGTQNLATTGLNAQVQNHLVIAHWDQVLWAKLMGQDFPLVFSPTYTTRWGSIGGGTDYLPVEINGFPYLEHYRTASFVALGLTIPVPLLTQPRKGLLTTYTIAPQWASPQSGANMTNNAQLVQILHVLWHDRSHRWQLDLQPSLYPNLLPTDQWPQHYFTMIYSLAYSFGHNDYSPYGERLTNRIIPFVQGTITTGGAMNVAPYGIAALYCQQLPCAANQVVPQLGGNHATQFQLKVGIGRPDVIPL
jgi:hypothetical protein